ncbi:AT-hook motif nuclear-localized protein 14-like [Cucurbita maxima]|uniref:AT-hook motif nuclear-localized protein n=1 Tax=Cucurbita maxima TaxID=3661 RepID=A0A6J1HRZ8_CUCMA|nr:AT-hook motif nuclear-localized protein 14-like [Cucurbita maxima]XP_022965814.1 AT-hook motif nuclear-localized protein 14-like [Cucurbita maxima]
MEPNDNQLSSYFHHHQHHHQSPTTSPTNGLLPSTHHLSSADATTHVLYPHSVPSAAVSSSPLEPGRRKRGRPRKYGTPEEALAAKKAATASSHSSSKAKKDLVSSSSLNAVSASSKKSQLAALGNAGQGFAPQVIDVAAGEDVGQKIMLFMQQCKREICILSASGLVSNASLRQPSSSGGNVTYEGRFEIVSLCGSYVRTDIGGKTGGLSVCLSSADGHIIGGGVGGPLMAAGPVQVIVGTFIIDPTKEAGGGIKGDTSAGKLSSPTGGTSMSGLRYGSNIDLGGNQVGGNNEHQGIGESHFLLQPRGVNLTSPRSNWRTGLDGTTTAYDFTGRTDHHSPENGDYDQIPE